MYEAFFDLKTKPFSLLPDPEFLFLSGRHSIGLSLLEYSLTGQAGFCVITGEIGSGKTTLIRAFLGRVGREFTVGLISNTHASISDVAAWSLIAFGQKPTAGSAPEIYQELMSYLISEYGAGRQCILVIDEAQNLTVDALEEIRLLSNINSGKDLLLQIVLVGQPELLDKLRRPELRQFAQRIAISHHLSPLTFADTRSYIEHRLAVAGSTQSIFTEMAIGAVQYFSGGVPRLINSICDLAMVYAFADGKTTIDEELVFRVIADRQLSGIAPFSRTNPADDPAIRAEIHNLARSLRKDAEPAIVLTVAQPTTLAAEPERPAPVVANRSPGERAAVERPAVERLAAERPAAERPVAERPVGERHSVERPVVERPVVERHAAERRVAERPAADRHVAERPAAERPVVEQPLMERPVAIEPTPRAAEKPRIVERAPAPKPTPELRVAPPVEPLREAAAAAPVAAAVSAKATQEPADDYFFSKAEPEPDLLEGELLLTEIAELPADAPDELQLEVSPAVEQEPEAPRLNGSAHSLRTADVQRLSAHRPVQVAASTNRHNVPRELRAEESMQLAGNPGTLEPSQRSWWRRAFRRGN